MVPRERITFEKETKVLRSNPGIIKRTSGKTESAAEYRGWIKCEGGIH